jgi:hypothetical protein
MKPLSLVLGASVSAAALLASPAYAAPATTLVVVVEPTKAQVKTAVDALQKALATSGAAYSKKLEEARRALEATDGKKTYAAELRCNGANIIQDAVDADETVDLGACDFSAACYLGKQSVALDLFKAAMAQDLFHWDETWLEKPRTDGRDIVVDMVDGPNSTSETYSIGPCP